MVSPHLWIPALLIVAGLAQKHLLVWRDRHFYNPSNFALIVGLLFFYRQAHIVLGQLGHERWLGAAVLLLGLLILLRVGRWIIPLVFTLAYLLFQIRGVAGYDPTLIPETVIYRFFSVSFLVFILFMLTDPRTTPRRGWQQALFALGVAALASWLDALHGFRVQHLFMALFLLSPLVPLLSREAWRERSLLFFSIALFLLSLGAIIQIESQPPYYFEMDR